MQCQWQPGKSQLSPFWFLQQGKSRVVYCSTTVVEMGLLRMQIQDHRKWSDRCFPLWCHCCITTVSTTCAVKRKDSKQSSPPLGTNCARGKDRLHCNLHAQRKTPTELQHLERPGVTCCFVFVCVNAAIALLPQKSLCIDLFPSLCF